ncbi:MFS transporter [Actinophytocola sp. NPDC049390]|uniref:MFS transporter n=1 Tax=Actinophytocola sp. NPDC049390 TaxID=3363894 RepID=UPI003797F6E6
MLILSSGPRSPHNCAVPWCGSCRSRPRWARPRSIRCSPRSRPSIAAVGVALACGPAGYLVGIGLLVPLVDRFSPGRVLAVQFGVLAIALASSAAVSGVLVLGLVIGVIGACSAVGAGLSSVAGRLAAERHRATILGIVTAGISAGILAGRIVGGWLADEIGWHGTVLVLPATRGGTEHGYLATLRHRSPVPGPIEWAPGASSWWAWYWRGPPRLSSASRSRTRS